MLNVVVDTNTLYQGKRLRGLMEAHAGTVRLWGSVANLIETVTDITDDDSLRSTQARLRTLRDTCEVDLLPDFDQLVLQQLGIRPDLTDMNRWRDEVMPAVLGMSSAAEPGVNVDLGRQRRDEHAFLFRQASNEVIRNSNPDADTNEATWKVRMRTEKLSTVRTELWSPGNASRDSNALPLPHRRSRFAERSPNGPAWAAHSCDSTVLPRIPRLDLPQPNDGTQAPAE